MPTKNVTADEAPEIDIDPPDATPAPMTATEARELAERLEREERELAQRRAAARHEAEVRHWDSAYQRDDLTSARDGRENELRSLIKKADASLDDLFGAWRALRVASARAFAVRMRGAVEADRLDPPPREFNKIGVDATRSRRPHAPQDAHEGLTFNDVLAQHAQVIAGAAAGADLARLESDAVTAVDSAAGLIK
jgi:hypothetical protein